jgi:hypothetical protein
VTPKAARRDARRSTAAPRGDALEDRYAHNATVSVSGDVLTVSSDGAADRVSVADTGAASGSNITLTINNGAPTAIGPHIRTVSFVGRAGGDRFTYNLTGDLAADETRSVSANLDAGNDTFTVNLQGDLLSGSSLSLSSVGNLGRDTLDVNAFADVDIMEDARLALDLRGGAERDVIAFDYDGDLDGTIDFFLDGNAGDDPIRADLTLDDGSTGRVGSTGNPARMEGGTGDDTLTFRVFNNSAPGTASVFGQIGGGIGPDTAIHTDDVLATSVQTNQVVNG